MGWTHIKKTFLYLNAVCICDTRVCVCVRMCACMYACTHTGNLSLINGQGIPYFNQVPSTFKLSRH